jgi:hypothetical protein
MILFNRLDASRKDVIPDNSQLTIFTEIIFTRPNIGRFTISGYFVFKSGVNSNIFAAKS